MDLIKRCIVKPGSKINLDDRDPADTFGLHSDDDATAKHVERLTELQHLLYADSKHALLIVLQALDAGGFKGVVVMQNERFKQGNEFDHLVELALATDQCRFAERKRLDGTADGLDYCFLGGGR